jgi:uncharacterized phosphosugar-binding protein
MTWISEARSLLDTLEKTQAEAIEQASTICAEAIGSGGVVHAFGTGHSRIPVEELFPRYGSYPGWHPIVELSMTFHHEVAGANGQRQAMFIERVPGLAAEILRNFELRPTDAMILFSATGRNAVPVEMGLIAKEAGLPLICVTSGTEAKNVPPSHSSGQNLHTLADVVLDICTPLGDAVSLVPGWDNKVGPLSTISYVALVNWLKVKTAEKLAARNITLPVLTGPQIVGQEESERLFQMAYDEHAFRKASVLRKR